MKIENIKDPVMVVSREFFNSEGEIIACPIIKGGIEGPMHIKVATSKTEGLVQCEKLKMLDLKARGYISIDRLPMESVMEVADVIQNIFDYY